MALTGNDRQQKAINAVNQVKRATGKGEYSNLWHEFPIAATGVTEVAVGCKLPFNDTVEGNECYTVILLVNGKGNCNYLSAYNCGIICLLELP